MELFLAVAPAILVLILGMLTRQAMISLAGGVLAAAMISKKFALLSGISYAVSKVVSLLFCDCDKMYIAVFLLILGVFITLIHRSGGVGAYERFIKSKIKKPQHVEVSSMGLSSLLFIDDYFSSLTVGSVMHSITDSFKIPRAKLAWLVDSMAAPMAILCPFSSWVAAITGFLSDSGVEAEVSHDTLIHANPFVVYVNTMPFLFYSFLAVFTCWLVVLCRISFGPMHAHEKCALETGNCFNRPGQPPAKELHYDDINTSLADFLVPLAFLLFFVLTGILLSGGFILKDRSAIEAIRNSSAPVALFAGGLCALALSAFFLILRKRILIVDLIPITKEGISLMLTSAGILVLAWCFGELMQNDLRTGELIAAQLVGKIDMAWVPLAFYLTSFIISFSMGSTWATAAIMFPISVQFLVALSGKTIPVRLEEVALLCPTLGATLSGAIAGNHITLIADTTIMSATSTRMDTHAHFETQLWYGLPVIIAGAIGFTAYGFLAPLCPGQATFLSLTLAVAFIAITMKLCNKNGLSL